MGSSTGIYITKNLKFSQAKYTRRLACEKIIAKAIRGEIKLPAELEYLRHGLTLVMPWASRKEVKRHQKAFVRSLGDREHPLKDWKKLEKLYDDAKRWDVLKKEFEAAGEDAALDNKLNRLTAWKKRNEIRERAARSILASACRHTIKSFARISAGPTVRRRRSAAGGCLASGKKDGGSDDSSDCDPEPPSSATWQRASEPKHISIFLKKILNRIQENLTTKARTEGER